MELPGEVLLCCEDILVNNFQAKGFLAAQNRLITRNTEGSGYILNTSLQSRGTNFKGPGNHGRSETEYLCDTRDHSDIPARSPTQIVRDSAKCDLILDQRFQPFLLAMKTRFQGEAHIFNLDGAIWEGKPKGLNSYQSLYFSFFGHYDGQNLQVKTGIKPLSNEDPCLLVAQESNSNCISNVQISQPEGSYWVKLLEMHPEVLLSPLVVVFCVYIKLAEVIHVSFRLSNEGAKVCSQQQDTIMNLVAIISTVIASLEKLFHFQSDSRNGSTKLAISKMANNEADLCSDFLSVPEGTETSMLFWDLCRTRKLKRFLEVSFPLLHCLCSALIKGYTSDCYSLHREYFLKLHGLFDDLLRVASELPQSREKGLLSMMLEYLQPMKQCPVDPNFGEGSVMTKDFDNSLKTMDSSCTSYERTLPGVEPDILNYGSDSFKCNEDSKGLNFVSSKPGSHLSFVWPWIQDILLQLDYLFLGKASMLEISLNTGFLNSLIQMLQGFVSMLLNCFAVERSFSISYLTELSPISHLNSDSEAHRENFKFWLIDFFSRLYNHFLACCVFYQSNILQSITMELTGATFSPAQKKKNQIFHASETDEDSGGRSSGTSFQDPPFKERGAFNIPCGKFVVSSTEANIKRDSILLLFFLQQQLKVFRSMGSIEVFSTRNLMKEALYTEPYLPQFRCFCSLWFVSLGLIDWIRANFSAELSLLIISYFEKSRIFILEIILSWPLPCENSLDGFLRDISSQEVLLLEKNKISPSSARFLLDAIKSLTQEPFQILAKVFVVNLLCMATMKAITGNNGLKISKHYNRYLERFLLDEGFSIHPSLCCVKQKVENRAACQRPTQQGFEMFNQLFEMPLFDHAIILLTSLRYIESAGVTDIVQDGEENLMLELSSSFIQNVLDWCCSEHLILKDTAIMIMSFLAPFASKAKNGPGSIFPRDSENAAYRLLTIMLDEAFRTQNIRASGLGVNIYLKGFFASISHEGLAYFAANQCAPTPAQHNLMEAISTIVSLSDISLRYNFVNGPLMSYLHILLGGVKRSYVSKNKSAKNLVSSEKAEVGSTKLVSLVNDDECLNAAVLSKFRSISKTALAALNEDSVSSSSPFEQPGKTYASSPLQHFRVAGTPMFFHHFLFLLKMLPYSCWKDYDQQMNHHASPTVGLIKMATYGSLNEQNQENLVNAKSNSSFLCSSDDQYMSTRRRASSMPEDMEATFCAGISPQKFDGEKTLPSFFPLYKEGGIEKEEGPKSFCEMVRILLYSLFNYVSLIRNEKMKCEMSNLSQIQNLAEELVGAPLLANKIGEMQGVQGNGLILASPVLDEEIAAASLLLEFCDCLALAHAYEILLSFEEQAIHFIETYTRSLKLAATSPSLMPRFCSGSLNVLTALITQQKDPQSVRKETRDLFLTYMYLSPQLLSLYPNEMGTALICTLKNPVITKAMPIKILAQLGEAIAPLRSPLREILKYYLNKATSQQEAKNKEIKPGVAQETSTSHMPRVDSVEKLWKASQTLVRRRGVLEALPDSDGVRLFNFKKQCSKYTQSCGNLVEAEDTNSASLKLDKDKNAEHTSICESSKHSNEASGKSYLLKDVLKGFESIENNLRKISRSASEGRGREKMQEFIAAACLQLRSLSGKFQDYM